MSFPEPGGSAHSGCLHSSFNPAYTAEGDLGRMGEGGMRVNGLRHDSHISRREKYIANFDKVADISRSQLVAGERPESYDTPRPWSIF